MPEPAHMYEPDRISTREPRNAYSAICAECLDRTPGECSLFVTDTVWVVGAAIDMVIDAQRQGVHLLGDARSAHWASRRRIVRSEPPGTSTPVDRPPTGTLSVRVRQIRRSPANSSA